MRGLDRDFLAAMREGLERGRNHGYVGWDERWECLFDGVPKGPHGLMMARLLDEVVELIVALSEKKKSDIRSEAADVANLAMMIADIHGTLNVNKLG